MSRTNLFRYVSLGIVLVSLMVGREARAEAFFTQFGTAAPILAPGQGVEFILGGAQRPGPIIPELSFHLRLFINRGPTITGQESPLPEHNFSPGDVVRFRMGDAVVIYQYDDPTNIEDPLFLTFGFYAPTDIDDNFGPADPIGQTLAAADMNGTPFSMEVLAGDGLRFTGLEFSDSAAGTFQMGGASTLVRTFDINRDETVLVDFESVATATPVTDQFEPLGVTFLGDPTFDEQGVIDVLGVGFDLLEARMLVNQSPTPPLGRSGFLGMRYARPVGEVSFDFAGPDSLIAALFDGAFVQEDLVRVDTITGAVGPSGLPEGTATLSHPPGFDAVIVAESQSVFIDNVSVTFLPGATVDFEGFHEGTVLLGQLSAAGVTFFGDEVVSEETAVGGPGPAYDLLEGMVLTNNSIAPPTGNQGFIGMTFQTPVSSVRFDYSGPTILVGAFLGGFTAEGLLGLKEFVPALGSTGFLEGTVVLESPTGLDGIIVAEGVDNVVIDNVSVTFLPE